jgi:hypothetical protein
MSDPQQPTVDPDITADPTPDPDITTDPDGTPKENPSGNADPETEGDTASGGAPD